jgi:DNA-binding NtrC family response regulator
MPHPTRSALIVDDDAETRHLVSQVLLRMDCDPVEAEDGLDALGKLVRGSFDLVVIDLHSAFVDGSQVLATLKEIVPGMPTVTLTADASIGECVAAICAGAADCVAKPFRPAELQTALEHALGRLAPPVDDAPAPERLPRRRRRLH